MDAATVERLIAAIQQAVVDANTGRVNETGGTEVPAPELATALLSVLATVVEPAPQCRTPMGMRRVSEAAGKELLALMRDVRRLRTADRDPGGALN